MIAGTKAEYQLDAGSKKTPHNGQAMGCLLWIFFINWPRHNSTALNDEDHTGIFASHDDNVLTLIYYDANDEDHTGIFASHDANVLTLIYYDVPLSPKSLIISVLWLITSLLGWLPWPITDCCILTHQGWVMHICVSNPTIIGSDNGLSPGQCQEIIWTKAGILLIEPLGTNFSEISIAIHTFSFKKMRWKMLSAIWLPFCPWGDELSNNATKKFQHGDCFIRADIKCYHGESCGWWLLFSIKFLVCCLFNH